MFSLKFQRKFAHNIAEGKEMQSAATIFSAGFRFMAL